MRTASGAKPKQLGLFARSKDLDLPEHGGDTRLGLRKTRRPFSRDAVVHLVFKSDRAKGDWSLLHRRNRARVEQLIYTQASKAGVKVYRHAVVGNHLHVLAKPANKAYFTRFLRALPGLIARHVTRTERSKAQATRPRTRFWRSTVYSRFVGWGREYTTLKAYLGKNQLEAVGFGGAKLRITPDGRRVVVVGDPDYRPGVDNPLDAIRRYDRLRPQAAS